MKFISAALLAVAASQVEAVPAQKPTTDIGSNPILFDGRIPQLFRQAKFDSYDTSPYNAQYVLGAEPWSKVIQFWHSVEKSLFDVPLLAKTMIVTINHLSIFQPGDASSAQTGFRRSELLPGPNSGDDITTNGRTAHHFSIRNDPARPLNYSHEYQPTFIETQDYSSHVWQLKIGTPFGESWPLAAAKTLRFYSSSTSGSPVELMNMPFVPDIWHNFAVELDWDNDTLSLWHSVGQMPLMKMVGPIPNDNSGKGQWHIGLLKLPTGPPGINVVKEGYQYRFTNEGIAYGGIFIEDVTNGEVTTAPHSMMS